MVVWSIPWYMSAQRPPHPIGSQTIPVTRVSEQKVGKNFEFLIYQIDYD